MTPGPLGTHWQRPQECIGFPGFPGSDLYIIKGCHVKPFLDACATLHNPHNRCTVTGWIISKALWLSTEIDALKVCVLGLVTRR